MKEERKEERKYSRCCCHSGNQLRSRLLNLEKEECAPTEQYEEEAEDAGMLLG